MYTLYSVKSILLRGYIHMMHSFSWRLRLLEQCSQTGTQSNNRYRLQ